MVDTAATPATVLGEFDVDDVPTGISVDPSTGDVVVVTTDSNTASWLKPAADGDSAALLRTEPLGTDAAANRLLPLSASVRADGTTLVVTQAFGATDPKSFVTVIPAIVDSEHPVRTIPVGDLAFWGIEDTRAGGTLYIPNTGNGTISTVSDVTLATLASTVSFGAPATAVATLTRADRQPLVASVAFSDAQGAPLGTAAVDGNGRASFDLGARAVGSVSFTATVATPSTIELAAGGSATTTQAATATAFAFDAPSVSEGADATATVSVTGAHGTVPTGAVTVRDSAGDVVGEGTLSAGSARIVLADLPVGSAQLVANYDGDSSHRASASAVATLAVTPRTPTLILDDPNLVAGAAVTLQLAGFASSETVELTLHSDPIRLGAAAMNAAGTGSFSFTTPVVEPGAHTIIAVGATSGRTVSFAVTIAPAAVVVTPSATPTPTPAPQLSESTGDTSATLASTGVDPVGSGFRQL